MQTKHKICFVLTVESAVKAFLLNHLRVLSQFYDITVIVNTDNPNFLEEAGVKAKVIPLKIAREISLLSDLICLFTLIKIFHQQRFTAVHSITPKAGLLGMLSAWVLRLPLRIHTFQGEVWVTKKGIMRQLLIFLDKLVNRFATNLTVVSLSERKFLVEQKIVSEKNSVVFGHGSISGVNFLRFKPNHQDRAQMRNQFNIPDEAITFLFIGRLNIDKGVLDLASAFNQLNSELAHLLCVGSDEQNMHTEMMNIVGINSKNIHFVGHTNMPEAYMAAADVLCLPSYREGFGMVIIEAAAVGIPAIASRIYGITDAVIDGETGLLHEPRDIEGIKYCMQQLIDNEPLRLKLGEQARSRAIKNFDSNVITQAWVNFYRENVPL